MLHGYCNPAFPSRRESARISKAMAKIPLGKGREERLIHEDMGLRIREGSQVVVGGRILGDLRDLRKEGWNPRSLARKLTRAASGLPVKIPKASVDRFLRELETLDKGQKIEFYDFVPLCPFRDLRGFDSKHYPNLLSHTILYTSESASGILVLSTKPFPERENEMEIYLPQDLLMSMGEGLEEITQHLYGDLDEPVEIRGIRYRRIQGTSQNRCSIVGGTPAKVTPSKWSADMVPRKDAERVRRMHSPRSFAPMKVDLPSQDCDTGENDSFLGLPGDWDNIETNDDWWL